ncbi:TPA: DEAD/DEAH box helicase [archaeon]|uniref:ATP-dependent DNA helicase Hel308 n=1 Tax=Candidatus Naiadarchaeum limnaeum TaxID=2756139 RepID=A0A832XJ65_9ARCH|nr:DEAD/DEAH box helicase [Candidatus Naiadarchaeales archaeon SRR2090153.bin1042]HIK00157.1 DEAD/DEAH box helicase [Candidatus Naiadarchaeum limnaeum]
MKLTSLIDKYSQLRLPIAKIEKHDNVTELYPPQAEAIKAGALDGKNLVLSVPTASGKTLVAELVALNHILSKRGKAVYIVPLRALASEKYEDFKTKYSDLCKIGISTGDFDSSGANLGNFDLLLLTIEKMDSLMRHQADWIKEISLVILDEIHLLDSVNRGPALEIVATQLKDLGAQILALSATIENSDELARWLNAKLVESSFRPIKLSRGVYLKGEIDFKEKEDYKLNNPSVKIDSSVLLATDIVNSKAQALVFANTRKGAESEAEKTAEHIYKILDTKEKKELFQISKKILSVLDSPTRQCQRLADCVKNGVAFHHAGLHSKQRHLIEKNFKENLIKVICATPTLAAGVNLPAKRVVIRDYKRFNTFGSEPIPVLEIHQMFGRAGRPKYDTEGEAVLIAKSDSEFNQLWDVYIEGRPEEITSKLGVEPILRMHILGIISQMQKTKNELYEFFEKTFYAFQYRDLSGLETIIDRILDQLFDWKFIDNSKDNRFKCTKLGLRVAQLYLDPLTAHTLIGLLNRESVDDLVLLTILSDTAEMRPLLSVRSSEELGIYEQFEKYDLEDEQIRAFKNAMIFFDWMDEKPDDFIFDRYNMPPGTMRSKLDIADWLLYSLAEIALILSREKLVPKVNLLRKRLKYGVKRELLPLIRIRDIGRVRARRLFNAGIKGIEDVRKAKPEVLEKLVGVKIAKKLIENLEIKSERAKIGLEKYSE